MSNKNPIIDDSLQISSSDLITKELISLVLFDAENYSAWKREMLAALTSRNKIGFINGSTLKPAPDSQNYRLWKICDGTVLTWIFNSVSREISVYIAGCKYAKNAWDELETRFGKTNGEQLYAIQRKLSTCSQGNDSIFTYSTKMKQIWDEIEAMDMNPTCSCACSCGASHKRKKFKQDQKVVQLLMGLNESYNAIRETILSYTSLPSIGTVYDKLWDEEKQSNDAQKRRSNPAIDFDSLFGANDRKFGSYGGFVFGSSNKEIPVDAFKYHDEELFGFGSKGETTTTLPEFKSFSSRSSAKFPVIGSFAKDMEGTVDDY